MKKNKKILIVDDEPKIRRLFRRQLKEASYRSVEADCAKTALDLLREVKDINLIILDILLPDSNGLDLFEKIKQEFPEIKVIVSSVYPLEDQEFFIWDAQGYYCKSDSISSLIGKVNSLLGE